MHIKECPFCGSQPEDEECVVDSFIYFVYCEVCKAGGPVAASIPDAINEWNRRKGDTE